MVLFGSLLLIGGLLVKNRSWQLLAAGLTLIFFGILFWIRAAAVVSDQAIDTYCRRLADDFYRNCCSSVWDGFGAFDDAFYAHDYSYENLFQARLSRRGRDHVLRSSIYEASCLLFGKNGQAVYFRCRWSLLTPEQQLAEKRFLIREIRSIEWELVNEVCYLVIVLPDQERIRFYCGKDPAKSPLYQKLLLSISLL